jgi:hypothetical protein
MRWPSGLAIAVLSVVVGVATTAEAKVPSYRVAKCSQGPSSVFAANEQAVVYQGPEERGVTGPETKGEIRVFGCDYAHKVAYVLGVQMGGCSAEGCQGIVHETLTGAFVAYAEISSTGSGRGPETNRSRSLLIVRDLRSGRVVRKLPTGTSTEPREVGLGEPLSLVVKSNGAIAWIVSKFDSECPTAPTTQCYEVHVADRRGTRVVAASTEIDPLSLALARSTVYWTQGGKPESAALD